MSDAYSSGRDGKHPGKRLDIAPFSHLLPETLHMLAAICQVRSYHPGQTVTMAGETASFVGFVQSGILRMQKSLPGGRRHIVALLMDGDMFGRIFNGPMPYAIEAAVDSQVLCFPRGAFESLVLKAPDLDRMVMLEFLHEIDRSRDWMIVLGNPRVRGRIGAFLIVLCTRYRKRPQVILERDGELLVQLPVGRQDIADLLGTRTESISRALHALQDDGILRLLRPDLILIRDLHALAQEAGGDSPDELSGLPELLAGIAGAQNRSR